MCAKLFEVIGKLAGATEEEILPPDTPQGYRVVGTPSQILRQLKGVGPRAFPISFP